LGFHSFGLYIHNDTMRALGRPQDMFSDSAIQLRPVFAQWIQGLHAGAAGSTAPNALAGVSEVFNGSTMWPLVARSLRQRFPSGTADFMVHHIHAFTIHVTVLILLKGVLYARSSRRLIPDKANLGFRFPLRRTGPRWHLPGVCLGPRVPGSVLDVQLPVDRDLPLQSWKMQSDVWGAVKA
jgi:photosystem I P700 chlorophyll a apoprotein A1